MAQHEERSSVLPTDPFDIRLSDLMRASNGTFTAPHTVQYIDPYGNSTTYTVQTVKGVDGEYIFVTQASAAGMVRYILPPRVLALVDRQRQTTVTQLRRRHGHRIAEERAARGEKPGFMRKRR